MATVTTNNGWDIPQSTDLVKDGATAIAALGQDIDTSVGTGLLAWTTFVPTITSFIGVGNGVWNTTYAKIGKIVHWRGSFTCGTSTTFSAGSLAFNFPVTPKFYSVNEANGNGKASYRNGTSVNAGGISLSNGQSTMYVEGSAGTYVNHVAVNSTNPFTWAATSAHTFSFNVTYEAA